MYVERLAVGADASSLAYQSYWIYEGDGVQGDFYSSHSLSKHGLVGSRSAHEELGLRRVTTVPQQRGRQRRCECYLDMFAVSQEHNVLVDDALGGTFILVLE